MELEGSAESFPGTYSLQLWDEDKARTLTVSGPEPALSARPTRAHSGSSRDRRRRFRVWRPLAIIAPEI